MGPIGLLVLLSLTGALGAGLLGRRLGLRRDALGAATRGLLECAGLALVLLVVNTAVAVAVVLVGRGLLGRHLSIYFADDPALPLLSLLEAVLFQLWRQASQGSGGRDGGGTHVAGPRDR